MIRKLCLLLTLVLAFSLTACGKSDTDLNKGIELSEDLYELEFALDGTKLSVPLDIKDLEDAGWRLTDNPDDVSHEQMVLQGIQAVNNNYKGCEVFIRTSNTGSNQIANIMITNISNGIIAKDYPDLTISNGIKFGSSLEDVENAFGISNNKLEIDDVHTLTYSNEKATVIIGIHDKYGVTSIGLMDKSLT